MVCHLIDGSVNMAGALFIISKSSEFSKVPGIQKGLGAYKIDG